MLFSKYLITYLTDANVTDKGIEVNSPQNPLYDQLACSVSPGHTLCASGLQIPSGNPLLAMSS